MKSPIIISARPGDFVDLPAGGKLVALPRLPLQCWGLTKDADCARPHRCCQYVRGGTTGRWLTCHAHRRHERDARALQAQLRAARLPKIVAAAARQRRQEAAE